MKAFIISLGLIVVISGGSALALNALDRSAQTVHSSADTRP